MISSGVLLFFCLALFGPLLAGLLALTGGQTKLANTVSQGLLALSSASGVIASLLTLGQFSLGAWEPYRIAFPEFFGTVFHLDGWAAAFLLLVNLGVFLSSVFAIGYLPRYMKAYSLPLLNFVTGLFVFGMQATILAGSVFAFMLFWEVMSVAAYFLVIADREQASLKAGFLYFVMTHFGAACLLAGFLILANGDASASFALLAQNATGLPSVSLGLAFVLLFIGFGSKAGLVPLHQWLPYAHPQAPSNSSALMSGVMLKVAVYGFLRVAFEVFPRIPTGWAVLVAGVGLISAVFGVLYAAVETDLKRLLAWSSIENLGLIFAMIGTGFFAKSLGLPSAFFWVAAGLHALNHALFKSGLFMAAGSIISETHTRDLDEMGGLAKAWPAFSGWFLGLVFAASALPPLGTFYGEWIYLQALAAGIGQGSLIVSFLYAVAISLVALVGGLAVFTFAKTFSAVFLSKPRTDHAAHVHPLPGLLVWPIAGSVLGLALIGWFAAPIADAIGRLSSASTLPFSMKPIIITTPAAIQPLFVFALVLVLGLIVFLVRRMAMRRTVRITDTWDCGQPVTARMEYTATGFAAPIRFFFRSILLSKKEMLTRRVTPDNAWIVSRRLEWSTQSLWEYWFYQPLAKGIVFLSERVKRLQNGIIQFYILLVLVTLIIVLAVAL